MEIRLVDVYEVPEAAELLYRLMQERPAESAIAHRRTPSMEEHRAFMAAKPYRAWCLVNAGASPQSIYVGAVTLTPNNEVGVFILREFQRRGYARAALIELMRAYKPMPGIAAVRPGHFVANVNPKNEASIALFTSLGGRHIANTYEL
jgi:RimJ/RimL family protein N-acetyltransferase